MVHKKYIKRGDKVFGPYFYENYRVNGVTKTKYLGLAKDEPQKSFVSKFHLFHTDLKQKNINKKSQSQQTVGSFLSLKLGTTNRSKLPDISPSLSNKKLWVNLVLGCFFIAAIFLFFGLLGHTFFSGGLTGRAVLDISPSYILGENISGNISLNLKQGELIPANSLVRAKLNNQEKEVLISDLISSGSGSKTGGNFYTETAVISGSGEGYGTAGTKEVFPDVSFVMKITSAEAQTGTTPENQTQIPPSNETTTPEQNQTETPQTPTTETSQQNTSESLITGQAVTGSENEVSGNVSKDKPFTYTLNNGENAEIVSSSQPVKLSIENNIVIITTDYSAVENGFGKDYVNDKITEIDLDLSKLGFKAEGGNFVVSLVYNNNEILSVSKEISVAQNETTPETNQTIQPVQNLTENQTLPSNETQLINITQNETLTNLSLANLTLTNLSLTNLTLTNLTLNQTANETLTNITLLGNLTINTTQYGAVLNKPVKWVKNIKLEETANISIELPVQAENISVYKIVNKKQEELEVTDLNKTKNESDNSKVTVSSKFVPITGEAVVNTESGKGMFSALGGFFQKMFSTITGNAVVSEEKQEVKELTISENATEYEIEYYTEAPTSSEKNLSNGKEIVVAGPDELHYENVLAYTSVDKEIKLSDARKIRLIWASGNNTEVSFTPVDDNNDSFIDYIEWTVPHLSNQTYELIYITKAEHLDENKSFISDIYEQVKLKDNIWSEKINNNEYVRVTFERYLDKSKDITIYAKTLDNSSNSQIEVYSENSNKSIATFENITNENWYRVNLTGLNENESYNTFDLKVLSENNSGIQLDYIVDPTIITGIWNGTFNLTMVSGVGGVNLTLNWSTTANTTYNFSGDYTSPVIDAGGTMSWKNMSWSSNLGSYFNTTGSFSASAAGAGNPVGMTFDSRDNSFWIADQTDGAVYHFDSTGANTTGSFSTSAAGAGAPSGIAFDSRDNSFWISDASDSAVYHFNSTGANTTGSFKTSAAGAIDLYGIALDPRDYSFWIPEYTDDAVYHFDSTGANTTGSFSLSAAGAATSYGIAFDSRDNSFWVVDRYDIAVYHFSSTGTNQTDGFKTTAAGAGSPTGIALDSRDNSLWIPDGSDFAVYHFAQPSVKFQVRSCNDNACNGETFVATNNLTSNYFTSSPTTLNTTLTPPNQYFQYKAYLSTPNNTQTPTLYNVTINYLNDAPPVVTLNTPENANNTIDYANITFNCSMVMGSNELSNVSLFVNVNGSWVAVANKSIFGATNQSVWNLNLNNYIRTNSFSDNNFKWNCLVYDNQSYSGWAANNYTFSSWNYSGTYNATNLLNYNIILANASASAYNTSGTYTSKVFGAGGTMSWKNISLSDSIVGTCYAGGTDNGDGTCTLNITATNAGYVPNHNATYATARNATAGTGAYTNNYMSVGQTLPAGYYIERGFASFVIPNVSSLTTASFFLYGGNDYSTPDFIIYIHTSTYSDPLVKEDFDLFDGHQANGAYNGTILNNAWNTSSYSATWNNITFNAAGFAAILAKNGSTFKMAVISKEDYDNSVPVSDEYIEFTIAGHEPYLSITYPKGSLLALKFQARSCNDNACNGETFVGIDNTSATYFTNFTTFNTTITPPNQYFQYKAYLSTSDSSITPTLYNVTINYLNDAPPTTTLNEPANSSTNFANTTFNCSMAQGSNSLLNVSLYHNVNGSWSFIANQSVSGSSGSGSWNYNLYNSIGANKFVDASYKWNCLVYDNYNYSAWATSNATFSSWNLGTHNATNVSSSGYLTLANTTASAYNLSGTYTSQVFNAKRIVTWKNMSWTSSQDKGDWNYTGLSYSVADTNPDDLWWNGSNWFIVGDTGNQILQYNSDFTSNPANFSIATQDTYPEGIFWNGSNWYMVGEVSQKVWEYDSNWVATGKNWSVSAQEIYPRDIDWNGSNWFIIGNQNDKVWEYDSNWVATGKNWSVSAQDGTPRGMYWDGTNWWVTGGASPKIFKYDSNWVYTGTSFSITQDSEPRGMYLKDNNFYLVGYTNDKVYKYGYFNLKFQARSCNDALCDGETFVGGDNTSASYFTNYTNSTFDTIITPNNEYFQYKAYLSTTDSSITPTLYNVTINYIDNVPPVITIDSPLNTSYPVTNVNFNVSLDEAGSWCGFSLDGAENVSMTKADDYDFGYTQTDLAGTGHSIVFSCNDTSNNYGSNSIAFTNGMTGCAELNMTNGNYILSSNLSSTGTCFNITANNVVMNGNGYSITYSSDGTLGYGIYSKGYNFTSVGNLTIIEGTSSTNSKHGIYLLNANNLTIINNTILAIGAGSSSIYLESSSGNNITNNILDSSYLSSASSENEAQYGIFLNSSSNSNFANNNTIGVNNGYYGGIGIRIESSSANSFTNNNFTLLNDSGTAFKIKGSDLASYTNTIATSNQIYGKQVNYSFNLDNNVFDTLDYISYGQVIFAYSRNIIIRNSNFSNSSLSLFYTNNSIIENNSIIAGKGKSIWIVDGSSSNVIRNNVLNVLGGQGILIFDNSTSLINNTITTNSQNSIIVKSASNILINNTIQGSYNNYCIELYYNNNTIDRNTFIGCRVGFLLDGDASNNIGISNSTITANDYGLFLNSSPLSTTNFTITGTKIYVNASNSCAILINDGSRNLTIKDSILNSSVGNELCIGSNTTGGIWNFTNVTRADLGIISKSWQENSNGTLIMNYYLDVNVSNDGISVQNANVSLWDKYTNYKFSEMTDSGGRIARKTLLEYTQINNSIFNFSANYSLRITLSNYNNFFQLLNLSTNQFVNAALSPSSQAVSSKGFSTNTDFVNYNENVNLTADMSNGLNGTSISSVWAEITRPDSQKVNVSLFGSQTGGIWNASYTHPGILGGYSVLFTSNSTEGEMIFNNLTSNFYVKNTSITINTMLQVNTTDSVNVNGLIKTYNGSDYFDLADNLFSIQVGGVTVSSNTLNHSTFSLGIPSNTNATSQIELNLSSESSGIIYEDDYSTTKYLADSYSYTNVGPSTIDGALFVRDNMNSTLGAGNITYMYTSINKFYNASVYVTTQPDPLLPGGNTSVWYSYDTTSWNILNSSTSAGDVITANVPVNQQPVFYIMLNSDISLSSENPVTDYLINYTNYNYPLIGNFTSEAISLPNITYTLLKWSQNSTTGSVKIQLRESTDGSSWGAWSVNYTNNLNNDISSFSKRYIQYRAWLEATNTNLTPVLYNVQILYFNASTNSTGGYDYDITIPTNSIGILPLRVSVLQSAEGIVGFNETNITVWARTNLPYYVSKNYSGTETNYTIRVNLTRSDILSVVNGTINITISNSSNSWSKMCDGQNCTASWDIPSNLAYGNYTINISGFNESAYYRNSSAGFYDYLEEKNTTANLYVLSKTISDFKMLTDYVFYWNASLTNTGKAIMVSPHVFDYVPGRTAGIKNLSEITPCPTLYPGQICNATMMITISGNSQIGPTHLQLISWMANWTNNDGRVINATYTSMYILIEENSTMSLSNYTLNLTVQHNQTGSRVFRANSIGSTDVLNTTISFISTNITSDSEALSSDWVSITPTSKERIFAGRYINITINVTVPNQTTPGNYSGIINVSAETGGERLANFTLIVPLNSSWYFVPTTNFTYNRSFSLIVPGEVGNYTLVNLGNVNLTINISYLPAGSTDFTLIGLGGLGLIESNYVVNGIVTNPTQVNITKGENTTITIYQKGSESERLDVGIIFHFFNETATPQFKEVRDAFTIADQPPNITNIYFYVNNQQTNIVEQNRNVTIKVRATDDTGLNLSGAMINLTWSQGYNIPIPAEALTADGEYYMDGVNYLQQNYSANYTPTQPETYTITASVLDKTGKSRTSAVYTFTAYGKTTLNLAENISSAEITKVDLTNSQTIYVNFSVLNTGIVTAYSPNITFTLNSSMATITPQEYLIIDLLNNSLASEQFQINISKLTPPGLYNITARLVWINPDTISDSVLAVLYLNVSSSKSITTTPLNLEFGVPSGSQNSSNLLINNTGNDLLSQIRLNCYTGVLCSGMNLTANETNFNISANSTRNINITIIAPSGLYAGTYVGNINISERNISKIIQITSVVPQTWTWTLTPNNLSAIRGISSSGVLQEVTIINTGNVNMTFDLGSTNDSILQPNQSSITVPIITNKTFTINYSTPEAEGHYIVNITVTNTNPTAVPPSIDIAVNLTATKVVVEILHPNSSYIFTGVRIGDSLALIVNATYQNEQLSNLTWDVSVGNTSCSSLASSYNSINKYWDLVCVAPTLPDGVTYNLTVTASHDIYGTRSSIRNDSIIYLDLTNPQINNITRNNIEKSNWINLTANFSDNIAVDKAIASITYPNWSVVTCIMSSVNSLYNCSNINLTLPGEYSVNYTVNDTTGNLNSLVDWFEVYDRYQWHVNILDYNSNPVSDVNITLFRPNTTVILLSNVTNSSGGLSLFVNKRYYDLNIKISRDEFYAYNTNFSNFSESNISIGIYRMNGEDLSQTIALYKPLSGIASNSTGFGNNNVSFRFNYSGLNYETPGQLKVIKCSSWNYSGRSCLSSWGEVISSVNRDLLKVTGNSTGFSAYFLAENKCGNGLCELTYSETTSSCSSDCKETAAAVAAAAGGGGGGGGGLRAGDLEKLQQLIRGTVNVGGVKLETTSIYKELFPGDSTSFRINLINTLNSKAVVSLSADGDVKQFISFETSESELGPNEARDVVVRITAPKTVEIGTYDGDLILTSGNQSGKIPVTIRILSPEGQLLDVKVQPLVSTIEPGKTLKIQTDISNLGKTKKVDVQFDLQLINVDSGEILTRKEEAFAVENSLSVIKELPIPLDAKLGKYMIKGVAYYSNIEQTMQASSIAYVNIDYPFYKKKIFGVPFLFYLLLILLMGLIASGFYSFRWLESRGRRFKVNIELNKLPQPGLNSAFIGKIAETDTRTFIDLNRLQMHTLIAGATGGGKTIAAQDVVETALLHNKSVIIFDPTAQWTGFLRKCEDKAMLKRYSYFEMKTKDAKAFNGIIKTIHDPYEIIDIKKYLDRPGEITIFNISHLTPKEIDIVVVSTIDQVFKSEPEESRDLKSLIVYDEVHRLLPKFGGSGQGFIQLERGAREFRKWGIGLVLISQVLSDFVGEIKANIGTEIQMGTRYEGDLERINMKYGEDILKSVVKESIGTGMVVNAEFNSGRPYFVSFRPILHSTVRLTNVELAKYEKYFDEIEDLEYQVDQLKKLNVDVLDLEIELKLTRSKVKGGQFQMADMYLESLRPRFDEQWKKLGKSAMHAVKQKLAKAEVLESVEKAKEERAKYIKKNPQEPLSLGQEILNLKKAVEEKKKAGKKTSAIELKISDLENRLKPFKGIINAKDAEGIKKEIELLKQEVVKI